MYIKNLLHVSTLIEHLQLVLFNCSKLTDMTAKFYTNFSFMTSPLNGLSLKELNNFITVDYSGVVKEWEVLPKPNVLNYSLPESICIQIT